MVWQTVVVLELLKCDNINSCDHSFNTYLSNIYYIHGKYQTQNITMNKSDVMPFLFFKQETSLVSTTFSPEGINKEENKLLKEFQKVFLSLIHILEKPIINKYKYIADLLFINLLSDI